MAIVGMCYMDWTLDIEECEHYDLFLFTMGEEPVKDLYSLSVYTFNLCD